jgi:hypothetical protein
MVSDFSLLNRWIRFSAKAQSEAAWVPTPRSRGSSGTNQDWSGQNSGVAYGNSRIRRQDRIIVAPFGVPRTTRSYTKGMNEDGPEGKKQYASS